MREFQEMQMELKSQQSDGIVTDHDAIARNLQLLWMEIFQKRQSTFGRGCLHEVGNSD